MRNFRRDKINIQILSILERPSAWTANNIFALLPAKYSIATRMPQSATYGACVRKQAINLRRMFASIATIGTLATRRFGNKSGISLYKQPSGHCVAAMFTNSVALTMRNVLY